MGEHKKNSRPSTEGQHEKGLARVDRDKQGGEKGDKHREYRKQPKKPRKPPKKPKKKK